MERHKWLLLVLTRMYTRLRIVFVHLLVSRLGVTILVEFFSRSWHAFPFSSWILTPAS